jgi:hypothetical protein
MIAERTDTADVALARRWADLYRMRGYNVLPSRPDAKRPFVRYAELWDAPAPADLFDQFPTTNLQVMTGRRWRLLVIDLDGLEARDRWARMGRCPRTWETHSGGDGLHLWFSIPTEGPPLPKAMLWKGEGEHAAIERLCDRSLVMAPPSIHPKTGRRYRFTARRCSPLGMPTPAPCPAWVLALEPLRAELPEPATVARPAFKMRATGNLPGREEVLAMVPDKIGVARSWGVRFHGRRSPSGWHPCHSIDREDNTPSAAVHEATGCYVDLGSGRRLSYFDLAITLGVYRDFAEAVNHLGGNHAR